MVNGPCHKQPDLSSRLVVSTSDIYGITYSMLFDKRRMSRCNDLRNGGCSASSKLGTIDIST